MTIDIAALRKFQDLWAPVMQAIPAVVELEAKQADMNRWIAAKQAEVAKADAEIAASFAEADRRLASVNEQLLEASEKALAARNEADELKRNAVANAKAATLKANEKLKLLEAEIASREARVKGMGDEIAASLAAAKVEREAAIAALDADIKALETRKVTAEKALEALRAKLG